MHLCMKVFTLCFCTTMKFDNNVNATSWCQFTLSPNYPRDFSQNTHTRTNKNGCMHVSVRPYLPDWIPAHASHQQKRCLLPAAQLTKTLVGTAGRHFSHHLTHRCVFAYF